jgi:hypothetical protein
VYAARGSTRSASMPGSSCTTAPMIVVRSGMW